MAIFKFSVIRSFLQPLTASLFILKSYFSTAKTLVRSATGLTIFRALCYVSKSVIFTNQSVECTQCFTKQLILKKYGSLYLIEILSLSLENLKVGVMS
jgi:hypothetical protein